MERDVTVTLTLPLTTTATSEEDVLRHALEVIVRAYEEHGIAILKDRMTVQE